MRRFNQADLRATPWKNGGGVTREIVSSPRGSGIDAFVWRVSIADVASDGPFSVFEGVDRVLVLLDGNGVVLRGADGEIIRRLDAPYVPFAFSGDERITSTLVAGPSVDFNVMTRRAVAHAAVRVLRASGTTAPSHGGVVFAARGTWVVQASDGGRAGATREQLDAGDGFWWDEGESPAYRVTPQGPDAVLLAAYVDVRSP